MGEACPGLTVKGFLPSMLVAGSAVMGATEFTYTTAARQDQDGTIHAVTRISQLSVVNTALIGRCLPACSLRARRPLCAMRSASP